MRIVSIVLTGQDVLDLITRGLVHARVMGERAMSLSDTPDFLASGRRDRAVVVGVWVRARHKAHSFVVARGARLVVVVVVAVAVMCVVMTLVSGGIGCYVLAFGRVWVEGLVSGRLF